MSEINRVWRLRKRPVGELTNDVLSLEEEAIPAPNEGLNFRIQCNRSSSGPLQLWYDADAETTHRRFYCHGLYGALP